MQKAVELVGTQTGVGANMTNNQDMHLSSEEDMVRTLQSLSEILKNAFFDVYENGIVWIPCSEDTPQLRSLLQEGILENNNDTTKIHNGSFCYEYSVAEKWLNVIREYKDEIF